MGWPRRLWNVLRPHRLSRDLERELAFHLAERADELRAAGMSAAAAEREARRRLGNYDLQKERTRDMDVLTWLDTVVADLRYAVRALRASPGFAFVAIVSLGLGIGANTAIFSLIDALVLRALPVREPGELMQVTVGDRGDTFTNPLWEELRDREDVFDGVAATGEASFNLADGGEARRVRGARVSGDFFRMLGVAPVLGRLIVRADDYRGCPGVAALGGSFWQAEYGGVPDVVGRTIALQGTPFEIIGVVDPSFHGVTVGRSHNIYIPLCATALLEGGSGMLDRRSTWWLQVLGRARDGLSLDAVAAGLTAIAPAAYEATVPPNYLPADQDAYRRSTFAVEPAASGFSQLREQYGSALQMLMIVVGLVLVVACANVANLLLARATARQREISVRLALGAARLRIMRQLFTESLVLASLGAALGVAFAWWGSRAMVRLIPGRGDPVALDLTLDLRVLGFTLLVATVAAVVFGFAPALRAGRADPQTVLRASGRGVVSGSSRFGVAKMLVAAQIGLSLAIVVAAGLLLGTFRSLWTVQAGFDRDNVLLVDVARPRSPAPAGDAPTPAERAAAERVVHDAMLQRLRDMPAAVSASAAQITPVGGTSWNDFVATDGYTPAEPNDALAWVNEVSDGFFRTLGTPLLAGRDFDERDQTGATRVAIVNEMFARRFFGPTNDVLGQSFTLGDVEPVRYEVVGIVANTKYRRLREDTEPIAYLARSQAESPAFAMSFQVRTRGAPLDAITAVKRIATDIEPSMTLQFTTLREQLAASLSRERMLALLSAFFGALALGLALIGLYGIMAYNAARRRNEIGIRIALGSARSRVLSMMLTEVGWLLGIGIAFGTALAFAGRRIIASFLFGLSSTDVRTLIGAAMLFAIVGLAAGGVPAWRASRADPMAALRED